MKRSTEGDLTYPFQLTSAQKRTLPLLAISGTFQTLPTRFLKTRRETTSPARCRRSFEWKPDQRGSVE
jgi:hypothetical protein